MLNHTELTQAESHAPIVQAQSRTHLNKTLKRQRAIHMDRYTHAQSHTTHTSREPCTNSTSSIAHPLEQNAQEAESYTHGQVHTCTELTQAESHAPIVQAQSHTHLNKTLKRQRAIHVDRYTHAQSHRTHTSKEPCTNSTSSIAHPLEQNARQRAIHMDRYTHAQSHRTHTSREPCTNSTSSIAHPLEQNAQEAESYTHGQVHTCTITQNSHKQSHAQIVQAQSPPT